jgi:hypothetical protein
MSSTDAAAGLSVRTGVTEAFRNWFGEAIYREKKRLGVEAGAVVDLVKSRQPAPRSRVSGLKLFEPRRV